MKPIQKAVIALAMAGAAMAPQAVSGESILTTRISDPSGVQNYLPALAADVPWLGLDNRAPLKDQSLPEASSVSALMLVPKPAEWTSLASRPAALRSARCKQC